MKKNLKATMKQRVAKTALRVVEIEKKTFDRVAERVGSVQARVDRVVQKRVESAKWLPKEGKQLVAEWMHTMKKGRGDFRKAMDVTFDLSSEFVKRVSGPVANAKTKAPATRKKAIHRPATV